MWPVPEFDERAFREALVNAFGHRDYASMEASVSSLRMRGSLLRTPVASSRESPSVIC